MSVRIAVTDPLPIFRRGIATILDDAGFVSETPDDLMAWTQGGRQRVIIMTLVATEDWALLRRLRNARPDVNVIAILEDASTPNYVRALAAGAVGALPRSASPEGLRHVLQAVTSGTSVLPIDVVRLLVSPSTSTPRASAGPSASEIEWLRKLAHGATVAQLAEQTGYSERAMFRLLRRLYAKMNVRNRTEALMHGRERGWL